jgi:hypothetical protein
LKSEFEQRLGAIGAGVVDQELSFDVGWHV